MQEQTHSGLLTSWTTMIPQLHDRHVTICLTPSRFSCGEGMGSWPCGHIDTAPFLLENMMVVVRFVKCSHVPHSLWSPDLPYHTNGFLLQSHRPADGQLSPRSASPTPSYRNGLFSQDSSSGHTMDLPSRHRSMARVPKAASPAVAVAESQWHLEAPECIELGCGQ